MESQHEKCFSRAMCSTVLKEINLSYTWTIQNFAFCTKQKDEFLRSSTFPARDKPTWCLQLYPRGKNTFDGILLTLCLVTSKEPEVRVKYKISILNAKEEIDRTISVYDRICVNVSLNIGPIVSLDELLDKANCLLPNNKLTILCELTFMDYINVPGPVNTFNSINACCKLSEDLSSLLESKKFCDVTLAVAGRELEAHKAILSARSKVFAAMFEHGMKEQVSNRVEIVDVDYKVLKAMVNFIYTGEAKQLDKIAGDLLLAADMYALEDLKTLCADTVAQNISFETAADILVLADIHNVTKLKEIAINFINDHITEVMETQGWQNIKAQSQLVEEILCAMVAMKIV